MEPRKGEVVRIVIKTVDGDDGEFKMDQSSTIEELAAVAMVRFKIEPSPEATYRLAIKSPDGQFTTLDLAKTLLDAGIKDGDVLWLGTEQTVGGANGGPHEHELGAQGSPPSGHAAFPASITRRNMHGRGAGQVRI